MNATAVVLVNLGGPAHPQEVAPFLRELLSDPAISPYPLGPLQPLLARWIARRRAATVQALYERIGGGSPIQALTQRQAQALEKALRDHPGIPPCLVRVAMRYGPPSLPDVLTELLQQGIRRWILLPLYPQYSITTTGSTYQAVASWMARQGQTDGLSMIRILRFHQHPGYLSALAETIREGIQAAPGPDNDPLHMVFSAHGVPLRKVQQGDPYPREVEETIQAVTTLLGNLPGPVYLGYQSRVGPLPWTGPSTEAVLETISKKGGRRVLLIPVSFVSDHLETLYEMDQWLRERALALGIPYVGRAPALNDRPRFIEALRDLVVAVWKDPEGTPWTR